MKKRKAGRQPGQSNRGTNGSLPEITLVFRPGRPLLTDAKGKSVTRAHVIATQIKPPMHLYPLTENSSGARLEIVFDVIGYSGHDLIRDPERRPHISRFYPVDCDCSRTEKFRRRSPCRHPRLIGPGTALAKDLRVAAGSDLSKADLIRAFGIGRNKVFVAEMGVVEKDQHGESQPHYSKIVRLIQVTDEHAFPSSPSLDSPPNAPTSTSTPTPTSTRTGSPRGLGDAR